MGDGTPIWEQYRCEFPVRNSCVFLDHAAVAPLPTRAVQRVQQIVEDMGRWGGAHWPQWAEGMEIARERAGRLLDCPSSDVALVKNTSHGLLIAAQSLPWREGDNIVAPAHEFPANIYPWRMLRDRGVSLRLVGSSGPEPVTAHDLLSACDDRTRAVTVSWVQFSTGYRVDLAALSSECRRRGVYLVVDAIQGLGVLPWPLEPGAADFVAADGHKWMLSVEGCGLFYVNPAIIDELVPTNIGWHSMSDPTDFLRYDWRPAPNARRFEEGSFNVLGANALAASLGLLFEVGIDRVWDAVRDLTDELHTGLARLGAHVRSAWGDEERSGIVAFEVPGITAADVQRRLAERGVIVSARAGALRVSPHFYNAPSDLEALLGGLADIIPEAHGPKPAHLL
ncbi:MAG: aminotransferase class V-fold PLP-dependent enzyme [Armatimonadota bacterium]